MPGPNGKQRQAAKGAMERKAERKAERTARPYFAQPLIDGSSGALLADLVSVKKFVMTKLSSKTFLLTLSVASTCQ